MVQADRGSRRGDGRLASRSRRHIRDGSRSAASASGLDLSDDALGVSSHRASKATCSRPHRNRKLALAGLSQPVTIAELTRVTSDVTHYDAFDLVDAALDGRSHSAYGNRWALRAEGAPVARRARLARVSNAPLDKRRHRGCQAKNQASARCAPAIELTRYRDVVRLATQVDEQVKGAASGDPWLTIEGIALRMAGVADPRAPRRLICSNEPTNRC